MAATCELCGTPVRVMNGDGGSRYYRPRWPEIGGATILQHHWQWIADHAPAEVGAAVIRLAYGYQDALELAEQRGLAVETQVEEIERLEITHAGLRAERDALLAVVDAARVVYRDGINRSGLGGAALVEPLYRALDALDGDKSCRS